MKPKKDLVGGHEGVGHGVAIGAHSTSTKLKVGDRVGIKYIGSSCMDCEPCRKGNEGRAYRIINSVIQPDILSLLRMPVYDPHRLCC